MKKRFLDLDNRCFTATMPPEIGSMSYTSGPGRYEVLRCGTGDARCYVVAYTRHGTPRISIIDAAALANELIRAEQEALDRRRYPNLREALCGEPTMSVAKAPGPVAQPPQQLSGVSVDDLVAAFEAFVNEVKKENFFSLGAVSHVREVLEARIAERES